MQRSSPRPSRILRRQGYSLVEMLAVVTVVVTLMAISMRGARKSWEGQEIRASALKLAGDISLASLTAVKLNRPVQVRFYRYDSPDVAAETPQFHAYQLLRLREGSATAQWEPLYELQRLEGSTIMASSPALSSLLDKPQKSNPQEDSFLMGTYIYMPNLDFTSVEFRPDGSTNLDPEEEKPWTLTLLPSRETEAQRIETDFKTLVLTPATGAVRIY
jgi:uncharacterized protein (TIGR02596 family)